MNESGSNAGSATAKDSRHRINHDDLAEMTVLHEGLINVALQTRSQAVYEIAQRLMFIINRTESNPSE